MKTWVIIQGRMGSSRLPGKVLKPLGSSVVLDYVVSRCRCLTPIEGVIVATSSLPQDDPIADWCESNRVSVFRGSEDDVLSRYYECARPYDPDYVIRVTADCPFLDYPLANDMIAAAAATGADIAMLDGAIPRGLPAEIISFDALRRIHEMGREPRHREHVTYYAYEHAEAFTQVKVRVPKELQYPQLRMTLDTEEDYQLCQIVANQFGGDRLTPAREIVEFLLAHPETAQLNAHVKQKPVV